MSTPETCHFCGSVNDIRSNFVQEFIIVGDYDVYVIGVCDKCIQRRTIDDLRIEVSELDDRVWSKLWNERQAELGDAAQS